MKLSGYEDIGPYLRESRESLNITLQQAADALHIRAKYLEALEAGELQNLPGKSYTRGYIRNYAQYLRLDVDEVLDAYSALLGPKTSDIFVPEQSLRQNLPARAVILLSLLGAIILYGCWYYGFHDRSDFNQMVTEVPEKLRHLLDKQPTVTMDKITESCLDRAYSGCFPDLHIRKLMPEPLDIYDVWNINAPPKEL